MAHMGISLPRVLLMFYVQPSGVTIFLGQMELNNLYSGRKEGYLQFKQTLPVIPAVRRQGEVSRELDRPDG